MTLANYGITVGSKTGSFNSQCIKDMVDLVGGRKNAICLRYQVPMSVVAPHIGSYNWKAYDLVVQLCAEAGVQCYLTLKKFPSGGNPTPAEASAFAMAIASRYGDKVAAIECGNEDFGYDEFGQLADVMNAVYTKVKAINPNVLVLPGSALQRNTANMKAAVATLLQRAGKSIDGLNVHTYYGIPGGSNISHLPQDGSVPNVPSFPQCIQAVKEVCIAQGYPNMSVFDTEYGFACTAVNHGSVKIFSEADQARHMLYCIDEARKAGVKHMSWFTLGYASPPDGMSLVQSGGRKTLAYQELKKYIAQYPVWDGSTPPPPPPPDEEEPEDPEEPPTPVPGPTPEQLEQARVQLRIAVASIQSVLDLLQPKS